MGMITRGLLVGGAVWIFATDSGKEFLNSITNSISVGSDISAYDCNSVKKLVVGEELQNGFGARFKIISIENLGQISKSPERITCSGSVLLSNGEEQIMRLSAEKSGDDILYRIQP